FFFSSRRRHTRFSRDWSSDVCSSDLVALGVAGGIFQTVLGNPLASPDILGVSGGASAAAAFAIVVLGLSGLLVGLAALLGAAAEIGRASCRERVERSRAAAGLPRSRA